MLIRTSGRLISSIFLFCSLFISPILVSAETDIFQKLFRDQEYKTLIVQLQNIGEANLDAEQYRLYVYSLSTIDLDDAEEAAHRAIEKFSNDPDMFLMHASIMGDQAQESIFSALGYAEKALASLNRAVAISPNEPKYLAALMTFYVAAPSIAGGDMDKALEIASKITSLDPIEGPKATARYHLANDDPKQALDVLNKTSQKYPNDVGLYSQLASVYVKMENYEQAIEHYEKACKVTLPTLSSLEQADKNIVNKRESDSFRILNSHYQIGRISLISETQTEKGIHHLQTYIQKYDQADIDVSGLPSLSWAKLRLTGLLMLKKDPKLASETIALVKLEDDSTMKKIHKKLTKQINKALR